jgi:ketosteroid isomerase-like protein
MHDVSPPTVMMVKPADSHEAASPSAADAAARVVVAELDRNFQYAVKHNDAATMREILHPQFILVLGDGRVQDYDDIVGEAERKEIAYEIQDEEPGSQTVRVWGDTAVVTAKLHIKGAQGERQFDRTLWFSDTYVRTDGRWRYALGQASLPLPQTK